MSESDISTSASNNQIEKPYVRKKDPDDVLNENYQLVYQNYWDHARHVEIERLSFVAATMVLVAGSLNVLAKDTVDNEYKLIVSIFMFIFTLFGMFILYSLRVPFMKFTTLADHIAINKLNIVPKYTGSQVASKGFRFGHMLMVFYGVMSFLFFCGIVYLSSELKVFGINIDSFIASFIIFGFIVKVCVYFYLKNKSDLIKESLVSSLQDR